MVCFMEKENLYGQMELDTKENLEIMKLLVMEDMSGLIKAFMKVKC